MHRPRSASVRLERRVLVSPVVRLTATRHATQPPRSPAVHNQLQHQHTDYQQHHLVATEVMLLVVSVLVLKLVVDRWDRAAAWHGESR